MAVGAEIKHNERENAMYADGLKKKNDKRRGGKGLQFGNEDFILDEVGGGEEEKYYRG